MGTGQDDAKTSHGTHDNGIDKGSGHGNQTLAGRFFGLCCSCSDRSASESGFIGEDTAGDPLLHGNKNRAKCTAGSGPKSKRTLDDLGKCSRNAGSIQNQNNDAGCNVENCHKRYYNRRNTCDTLNAAKHDQSHADG